MNQSKSLQNFLLGVLVVCISWWMSWISRSAIQNARAIIEITKDISHLKERP